MALNIVFGELFWGCFVFGELELWLWWCDSRLLVSFILYFYGLFRLNRLFIDYDFGALQLIWPLRSLWEDSLWYNFCFLFISLFIHNCKYYCYVFLNKKGGRSECTFISYLEILLWLAILFQTIKLEGNDFFPFFTLRTSHVNQWNESTFRVFNAKENIFYIFLIFNSILVRRY